MADNPKQRGFKWDPTNGYLEVWVNGTEVARFDDGTNDLRIVNGGVRIDSGGIDITAGTLVSDDTTACTSSTTGSIHTDGGVGVVKDVVVGSTARIVGKLTYADRFEHANAVVETITGNKTLDNLDSGKIFHCAVDSAVFTLPAMCDATLRGCTYTIVNTAADSSIELIISPGSADKIMGPDIGGTDDTDLHNTAASSKMGDMVTLMCDGTNGWFITEMIGTWTES